MRLVGGAAQAAVGLRAGTSQKPSAAVATARRQGKRDGSPEEARRHRAPVLHRRRRAPGDQEVCSARRRRQGLDPKSRRPSPHDVDALAPTLRDVSSRIHADPELGFDEHRGCAGLARPTRPSSAPASPRWRRGLGGLPLPRSARASAAAQGSVDRYHPSPSTTPSRKRHRPRLRATTSSAAGALGAFLALARQRDDHRGHRRSRGHARRGGRRRQDQAARSGRVRGGERRDDVPPLRPRPARRTTCSARHGVPGSSQCASAGTPSHAALAPWDSRQERAHRLPRDLPSHRLAAGPLPRRRAGARLRHQRRPGRQHHPRARLGGVLRARARHSRRARAGPGGIVERRRAPRRRAGLRRRGHRRREDAHRGLPAAPGQQPGHGAPLRRARPEGLGGARQRDRPGTIGAGSTDMGDVSHAGCRRSTPGWRSAARARRPAISTRSRPAPGASAERRRC